MEINIITMIEIGGVQKWLVITLFYNVPNAAIKTIQVPKIKRPILKEWKSKNIAQTATA